MAIMKNAEGYYDPTAGEAIKKVAKKSRRTPQVGEVWKGKKGDPYLVIATRDNGDQNGSNVCIKIFKTEYPGNINIAESMFVDPVKLYYMTDDYMTAKVKVETQNVDSVLDHVHKIIFGEHISKDVALEQDAAMYRIMKEIAKKDEEVAKLLNIVGISMAAGRRTSGRSY